MHAVHHTDAFILKTTPSGEANRTIWLYTRTFGLVVASVQGVRKSGAKLAMQLSEYSLASVDLVRGRDVWRLVSAVQVRNPFLEKTHGVLGRSFVRTLHAVERFCQGEEEGEALFHHLVECLHAVSDTAIDPKSFDTLSLWKVLVLLGYGTVSDENLLHAPFVQAAKELTPAQRTKLIREVNEIIRETHL